MDMSEPIGMSDLISNVATGEGVEPTPAPRREEFFNKQRDEAFHAY